MGFSTVDIADGVGNENIDMNYWFVQVFPPIKTKITWKPSNAMTVTNGLIEKQRVSWYNTLTIGQSKLS